MRGESQVQNFQENPSSGSRHTAEQATVMQLKCLQLVTNRNTTFKICSAHLQSATYECLGKSFQRKET